MNKPTQLQAGYQPLAMTITALTNMHPGSGKNNYGIIDNLVQRDVLTDMPTVNASSLKGALREYMGHVWDKKDERIRYIFGADTKEDEVSQGGAYVFLPAQLLSLPVRSDVRPFLRATSPLLIHELLATASSFNIPLAVREALEAFAASLVGQAVHFVNGYHGDTTVEQLELKATPSAHPLDTGIANLLGDDLVLVSDEKLAQLVHDTNLPIVARNSLENGISKNLWYEQVLPRQTRFFTVILTPTDDAERKDFLAALQKQPVQIGANASIGYGFSTFKMIGA